MLGPWGSRVGSGGSHWVLEGLRWVHDALHWVCDALDWVHKVDTNMLVFPMRNGRVGGLNQCDGFEIARGIPEGQCPSS